MKVVLFCGGMGMRMREVSSEIPKPLIPVCDIPIVVHLMKYYMHYGHNDFVLCLGYLGNTFEKYFSPHAISATAPNANGDRTFVVELPGAGPTRCQITLVHTGEKSNVGERLLRIRHTLDQEEMFMVNYADGLSDLDLESYLAKARERSRIVSLITIRPKQTFHVLASNNNEELESIEEMGNSSIRVNGGFFIMRSEFFNYIGENEDLLYEPMQRLIAERQVLTHNHQGFWACMDTLKEKLEFDERCQRGDMPWQVWRVK